MLLENKTVLVTGVANRESIAFATAEQAISSGARVVLAAFPRDLDAARDCAGQLPTRPPVLPLDLTDVDQLTEVREELRATVGHLGEILHVDGGHHLLAATAPPDPA